MPSRRTNFGLTISKETGFFALIVVLIIIGVVVWFTTKSTMSPKSPFGATGPSKTFGVFSKLSQPVYWVLVSDVASENINRGKQSIEKYLYETYKKFTPTDLNLPAAGKGGTVVGYDSGFYNKGGYREGKLEKTTQLTISPNQAIFFYQESSDCTSCLIWILKYEHVRVNHPYNFWYSKWKFHFQ